MPVKSVGFAVGNLRARENSLLKNSDLVQLASAENTEELAKMLNDRGFGSHGNSNDVPFILREETAKLWKYLFEIAPDISFFEPFLYENDFHNYKSVLKAVIRGTDYSELVILPSSVDISLMERAVKEKRFDLLPEFMSHAAALAYEALTAKTDPQLADSVIDAGCMKAQMKKAEQLKNNTVLEIIRTTVFYNNIKAALRAARAGIKAFFLEEALTETGVIPKKKMIAAAISGVDSILELLETATDMGGAGAAESFKISAGSFEKYVDDRVINTAEKCKYKTLGIEPVIGFMLARLAEIKDLRIIYSGVKTGAGTQKTTERLRELYG